MNKEIDIPQGHEAVIEGNKVIIREKGNEDERIRKMLIEIVNITPATLAIENRSALLSYLEKQKEQDVKVISWREPDDCADIPEGHYVVIAYKPGVFGLGYIGNGKVVCAPGQKPSGILYIPNADESIIVESKEQKPAEWSEEDEQFLLVCKNALQKYQSSDKWDAAIIYSWLEKRLKSLRPQSHWKPSEEQMNALENVIKCELSAGLHTRAEILQTLRNDLKKL